MKMAKATERDINAAGTMMGLLDGISRGYYPASGQEENEPDLFDPDDAEHLRRFYDVVSAALNAAPGWPGRVIGGMCYVILYPVNKIVDPDADTLELHPCHKAVAEQRDVLLQALQTILARQDTYLTAADHALALAAIAQTTKTEWNETNPTEAGRTTS